VSDFEKELAELINKHGCDNEAKTPDFILADFLAMCLVNFAHMVQKRDDWQGDNGGGE